MKSQVTRVVAGAGAFALLFAVYSAGKTRAAGIPSFQALTYSGVLLQDGVPVQHANSIQIKIYDSPAAGSLQCTTLATPVPLMDGRFRIPLADQCVTAAYTHPDLWVEVTVDGTALPRTRLGAVPFAVESAHAVSATNADRADLAVNAAAAASLVGGTATATSLVVNGPTTLGNGGTPIGAFRSFSYAWDPPSTDSGMTSSVTVTLPETGVVLGISTPQPAAACTGQGCVHSAGGWTNAGGSQFFSSTATRPQVALHFHNNSGVPVDPGLATFVIYYVVP